MVTAAIGVALALPPLIYGLATSTRHCGLWAERVHAALTRQEPR